MKKTLLPISLMCLAFGANADVIKLLDSKASGDVSVLSNGSAANVNFHITELETSSNKRVPYGNFDELSFKNLKVSNEVGAPALPYHSIIVRGLPSSIDVDVEKGAAKVVDGIVPAPAQAEKLRCSDCAQPQFTVDWNSYSKKSGTFYKTEYIGDFRGTPLTRVSFYPAQYNGDKEALSVYPEIRFTVKNTAKGVNLNTLAIPSEIITEGDLNKKYVIVSPKKFIPAMQELVDWKTKRGYEVSVYDLESIGATSDAVKAFFHELYNNEETRFTYALVVGHEKNFPTEYKRTSSSYRTPSDLAYFTYGGAEDFIADVFYGRIVADKVSEVKNQIAKTIEYETQSWADASGVDKTIGLASNEGYGPSDVDYIKAMLSVFDTTFGMTPTYYLQSNSDSIPTNVNATMSAGVAWFNYIGHGSGVSWSSQRRTYHSREVKKIEPGAVKPVLIDVACKNGNFMYGRQNLGVEFMNATNGGQPVGAVAYYGGSVNISWHPPAIMAVGMNRIVAAGKVSTIGEAILAGQMYLYNNHSRISEIKDNNVWYHLFGDPALKLNF